MNNEPKCVKTKKKKQPDDYDDDEIVHDPGNQWLDFKILLLPTGQLWQTGLISEEIFGAKTYQNYQNCWSEQQLTDFGRGGGVFWGCFWDESESVDMR